jgi:hypothetical protein
LHIVAFMWARHAMKSPICKVHEEDDMDMGGDWIAGCHVNVFAGKKKKHKPKSSLTIYTQKYSCQYVTIDAKGPAVSLLTRKVSVIFSLVFSCGFLKNLELSKIFGGKQLIIGLWSSWSSSSNRHAGSLPLCWGLWVFGDLVVLCGISNCGLVACGCKKWSFDIYVCQHPCKAICPLPITYSTLHLINTFF